MNYLFIIKILGSTVATERAISNQVKTSKITIKNIFFLFEFLQMFVS